MPQRSRTPEELWEELLTRRNITATGCWEYTLQRNAQGYGQVKWELKLEYIGLRQLSNLATHSWAGNFRSATSATIRHVSILNIFTRGRTPRINWIVFCVERIMKHVKRIVRRAIPTIPQTQLTMPGKENVTFAN